MRKLLCLTIVLFAACDDDTGALAPDLSMTMNADLSANIDLSVFVDRGPTSLAVDFEPEGLFWDGSTLYISTGSNQIITWTDSGGFQKLVTVPFAYAALGNNLSSLVKLSDGRILVDVIGLNLSSTNQLVAVNGNILIIDTNLAISTVPGLDQTRQRQGLTVAGDGTIYSSWYKGTGAMMPQGGVSKVSLASGETDLWHGLQKPYGIAVTSTAIFAADQKQNAIFSLPLASTDVDGGASSKLADVMGPDLMTLGPMDDLFVAGATQVSRVTTSAGTVSAFAMENRATRGVAYDADHRRLFVSEPDPKFPDAGVTAVLHILPVD
jgi:hypothetical protein